MKLLELKAKENKVVGRSIMNKPDFIASLQMKGLLLEGNYGTAAITKSHPANDARMILETYKTKSKTRYS